MGKQRRVEVHVEGVEYNLPVPRGKRRAPSTATFRPNESDFHLLLTEAFRSRLASIMEAHLNQHPESDGASSRNTEEERKSVPLGAFESYLQENFDSLLSAVKERLDEGAESEEDEISTQSAEHQTHYYGKA
ncbi:hypothetical protein BCV71DRAFT_262529 [Rhizopus microsporus]|uniref:Uncharacterized protein n=1 Tax=Rhizopus microsporus TaxID=58291 RepID=A0A1X0S6P0_RHIZD|nr:hypothetical protein BCV71DRAFT_262529 [Rhizopus microsporus]